MSSSMRTTEQAIDVVLVTFRLMGVLAGFAVIIGAAFFCVSQSIRRTNNPSPPRPSLAAESRIFEDFQDLQALNIAATIGDHMLANRSSWIVVIMLMLVGVLCVVHWQTIKAACFS